MGTETDMQNAGAAEASGGAVLSEYSEAVNAGIFEETQKILARVDRLERSSNDVIREILCTLELILEPVPVGLSELDHLRRARAIFDEEKPDAGTRTEVEPAQEEAAPEEETEEGRQEVVLLTRERDAAREDLRSARESRDHYISDVRGWRDKYEALRVNIRSALGDS